MKKLLNLWLNQLHYQYMSTVLGIFLIISLVQPMALSAEEVIEESETFISLDSAVQLALDNSPRLKARRSQYNAAAQIPSQVSVLPEPRLMLNAMNLPLDSFSLTQTPMTQIQVGVSQALPYPGKLALKQEIAEKQALATKETIHNTARSLVQRVKHLWWQLFYLDRSLDTVASNLDLLAEFIDVAETKYTVGQGLQQEVLLAHVELAKLEDNKLQIEAMRTKTQASFNALLNRNTAIAVLIRKKVSTELPKLQQLPQLVEQAQKMRPEIRQALMQISAAEGRMNLADKDYYPDFQLAAIYGWRQDETDFASVQFSMNLPFNTEKRQDKKQDQRKHEWLRQKYALQDLKNSIAEEIQQALADYERARKQTYIYQDRILPQAEQTVDSMLAGYQVNKVDFLNLLRSQVNLFNFQTQYWRAISSANQALAALEFAMGKEVDYEK